MIKARLALRLDSCPPHFTPSLSTAQDGDEVGLGAGEAGSADVL